MNNFPLVSIVITNYNREKTVGKAIESALLQDYPNLEIIISDNCSTDNSHQVISKYINDNRVKYYRNEENIGMLGNFKISFEERAKGEWITIVNSDDEYVNPRFLSQSIDLVNKYENVSIVKSGFICSSKEKEIVETYTYLKEFYLSVDFLCNFFDYHIDLSWMGVLLKRKEFLGNYYFDKNIIASDSLISLDFLNYGNICFNKNKSYKLNFTNSSASFSAFSDEQILKLFNEYNLIIEKIVKKHTAVNKVNLTKKIHFFLIKLILEMTISNNRSNLNNSIRLIRSINNKVLNRYLFSFRFIKMYILYFYPSIGKFLTRFKNR